MSKETLGLIRTLYRNNRSTYPKASLPLLYQTRTLLAFKPKNGFRQFRLDNQHFTSSTASQAFEDIPFQKNKIEASATKPSDHPKSTITAPERAIFDRIFKNLVKTETPQVSSPDDLFPDPYDPDALQDESLESIFDEAIKAVKNRPKKTQTSPSSTEQAVHSSATKPKRETRGGLVRRHASESRISYRSVFPPTLQQSLDAAREEALAATRYQKRDNTPYSGMHRVEIRSSEDQEQEAREPADEYERQIRDARREDKTRVTALLDAAKSDIEIWRVLEKEVFSRMAELNTRLKAEEKTKRAAAAKTKGRRPKNASALGVVSEFSTTPIPTKLDTESESQNSQEQPAEPQPLDLDHPQLSTPQPPPVHPLSLLQTNYASHLLHALRLLRTHHPTSPYAPALLPAIKRLGSISYVLGASAALYNELLYLRWVHYRDLHACADLVFEMIEHGVETNGLTKAVWRDADWKRKKAKGVEKAWWGLQGVMSGWERWSEGMREVAGVEAERREREAWVRESEVGDEEGGDGMEEGGYDGTEEGDYASEDPDVDIALTGDAVPSSRHGGPEQLSV
ncbi:hypothetical protein MMC13_000234 [Lambiella insularis]|nr:hypothetical protein [Lambiella insularis]